MPLKCLKVLPVQINPSQDLLCSTYVHRRSCRGRTAHPDRVVNKLIADHGIAWLWET